VGKIGGGLSAAAGGTMKGVLRQPGERFFRGQLQGLLHEEMPWSIPTKQSLLVPYVQNFSDRITATAGRVRL
jgi:hypothetical protein